MRAHKKSVGRGMRVASIAVLRWARDVSGATAVEFSLLIAPFVLLLAGIMAVGLQFFTIDALEHGVTAAARKLKTGEAQKGGLTFGDFRQLVCSEAGWLIPCDTNLVVHLKSGATFADLDPPVSCLSNGNLTPSSAAGATSVSTYSGGASATVVVTACYDWKLGSPLWQTIWNLIASDPAKARQQGKTILSSTIAFRSEPYQ